ncbi:phosphate signaling complex protein PhoU [Fuchsiella alkaliacetigena]|uniref:phosphate signaling complex protein PhoU n=1 Tax=Fuchsiella alkaliacetigena TaxID=957042 RepID=UPI00200B152C|nr:phosphate signaling complex protein PhoU [Fuchsiella alkaliacetigena]MCK8824669.1 phosphate signaling complex protein PhoU [Fuchsiella alkaliacetigena]
MIKKSSDQKLVDLKQNLLAMSSLVEKSIDGAVSSLLEQDLELAKQVIDNDSKIDELELKLEKSCLKLLTEGKLTAAELKVVSIISKIITDLELIGDHALNIARITTAIDDQLLIKPMIDIPKITEIVLQMLAQCKDSFSYLDANNDQEITALFERVVAFENQLLRRLLTYMMEDANNTSQVAYLLCVSKYLRNIADCAKNIYRSW